MANPTTRTAAKKPADKAAVTPVVNNIPAGMFGSNQQLEAPVEEAKVEKEEPEAYTYTGNVMHVSPTTKRENGQGYVMIMARFVNVVGVDTPAMGVVIEAKNRDGKLTSYTEIPIDIYPDTEHILGLAIKSGDSIAITSEGLLQTHRYLKDGTPIFSLDKMVEGTVAIIARKKLKVATGFDAAVEASTGMNTQIDKVLGFVKSLPGLAGFGKNATK